MINLVNQVTEHTAVTAIAATVGYGLTRAFTVLNPVAGATFFGSVALAGAFTNPIFDRNNFPMRPVAVSSTASITLGKMIQVALAWIATPHLTPLVTTALKAISAEVISKGTLVTGSISITPQVAGITALALLIILGYQYGSKAMKVCKNLGKALKAKLSSSSSFPKNVNPSIRARESIRESVPFNSQSRFQEEVSGSESSEGDFEVKRGQQEKKVDVKGKGCLVQ